jgi:single-strand DNA-binding protein
VCYVDIVVWGRQAEASAEYLQKGSPALIEGRLQLDQWVNQSGEKRSKLRVRADRVQFLAQRRDDESHGERQHDEYPAAYESAGVPAADPPSRPEDGKNLPF